MMRRHTPAPGQRGAQPTTSTRASMTPLPVAEMRGPELPNGEQLLNKPGTGTHNVTLPCVASPALVRCFFDSSWRLASLRAGLLLSVTQEGLPRSAIVPCQRRQASRDRSKLRTPTPQRKIDVKSELPVGSVSVFTLIRTDTTLDHSQKAEKV